jgi:hypothetical protein
VSFQNIPNELKAHNNWVVWKIEARNGKPTKPPFDANQNGKHAYAATDDAATWASFDRAVEVSDVLSGSDYEGVGFVFTDTDFVGIDLDGVVDADNTISPFAVEILKLANSYCELSPSGTGIHIIFETSLPLPAGNRKGSKKLGGEIYNNTSPRYFTVTGDKIDGLSADAIAKIDNPKAVELIHFMVLNLHNTRLTKLWMGDMSDFDEDHSRADQSLCNQIAAAVNYDPQKIDDFFSASKLGQRNKWIEREDYRERTIPKAIGDHQPTVGAPNTEPDIDQNQSARLLEPVLSPDALYGLAGDVVKAIEPQTESHPAGLLIQLLLYFGNIIGRSAYYQIESTRHYGNLFAVRVGRSSRGRKGTGGDRIDALFDQVDHGWFSTRVRSGLSSSEGLIVAIHDDEWAENKQGHPVLIAGDVHDKRIVSHEGEFSQLLVVMQRAGNTISTQVRNAWDGKPLRTMTIKPRAATNHTVSIMGDITATEAKTKMTADDSTNGFANRFLWVFVNRTKLLPDGGEEVDFAPFVPRLKCAIEFAESQERVFMDRNAREMWHRVYPDLTRDRDGLFGSIVNRGEAQVTRLALLYALLDCSDHIRAEHLHAALALWQYCEDSARYVFDALTSEQFLIIEWLREHGSQTKTQLLKELFKRNRSADLIDADLGALLRRRVIGHAKKENGTPVYFVQGRQQS